MVGKKNKQAAQNTTQVNTSTARTIVPGNSQNQVLIHVCDENKKVTQDFKCDRNLLLQHMKYFDKYLAE